MRELCGDTTLKHVVLVTQGWGQNDPSEPATSWRKSQLTTNDIEQFVFKPAIENGAQVYHRIDRSKPAQDVLRMILPGRKAVPKSQPELVDEGEESWQTAEPGKEMGELVRGHDSHAEELESMRKEMDEKAEEHHQELAEQKRRAQEEADMLRKCIAEMQSKLEEDRHESGKFFVTHSFQSVSTYPVLPSESGTTR